MQLYDQLNQLNDLPTTFKRGDLQFVQLLTSLAAGLTSMSAGVSGTLNQTSFNNATAGWIDVWGDLPGIDRRANEADSLYQTRLLNMLLAGRDAATNIELWLQAVEQVLGVVLENGPNILGYTVSIPATLTPTRISQIIKNLAYVRPAGVPFSIQARTGGLYLNTVDYLGATLINRPLLATPGFGIIVAGNPQTSNFTTGWTGGLVTGSYFPQSSGVSLGRPFISNTTYLGARKPLGVRTIQNLLPILVKVPARWQGGRVTGSYLASKLQLNILAPAASTNNQLSHLPDLLLTDPTVNPNLTTPLLVP